MRHGLRIVVTVALMACAYSLIAVIQLPNVSTFDPDPLLARAR